MKKSDFEQIKREEEKENKVLIFNFEEESKAGIEEIKKTGRIWLNGANNSNYLYIEDCYKGSPTNQGIIDKAIGFTHGKGLYNAIDGKEIKEFISKDDFKLICSDFKKYGQYAIQVIWEYVKEEDKMKPVKVKYLSVKKVGIEIDEVGEVLAYWYSFDFSKRYKYPPKRYYKFDGIYKGDVDVENTRNGNGMETDVEILLVQRPTDEDFFVSCDYESALEYAELESLLKVWGISHVKNGFQGGMIINANNGVPATKEEKKATRDSIINGLTGVRNAKKVIVSFQENKEQELTIQNTPNEDVNEQYVKFDESAEEKLIKAHGIPPILATGSREGGGLGNNSEEIRTATESYYMSHILPYRETILTGLNEVAELVYNSDNLKLEIRDFKPIFLENNNDD